MGVQASLSWIAHRELVGVVVFAIVGVMLVALAPAKAVSRAGIGSPCVGWTLGNRHHQSRLSTFLGTSFVGSVGSPVLCSAI
jgi:hypothetical protein